MARSKRSPTPQPSASIRSFSSWFCAQLVGRGAGDVEDLAAQRQHRLGLAVARLLGRTAGANRPRPGRSRCPRRPRACSRPACRAGAAGGSADLRAVSLRLACGGGAPRRARSRSRAGCRPARIARQPMVEVVAQRAFSTSRAASALVSFSLVWPWNCGSRMKSDSLAAMPVQHVVGGDLRRRGGCRAARPRRAGPSPGRRGTRPRACRPAVVGHGVAVGVQEAVAVLQPGDRPFHRLPVAVAGQVGLAGPDRRQHRAARRRYRPPGSRAGRRGSAAPPPAGVSSLPLSSAGIAGPADFDAAEQVGLGAAQPVEPRRLELQRRRKSAGRA